MSPELVGVLVGGLIGGLAGLSSSWVSGRFSLKQARTAQVARDRSVAYKELAGFTVRLRAVASMAVPGKSDEIKEFARKIGEDAWFDAQANAEAFGSRSVREAFDDVLSAKVRLAGSLSTWEEVLQWTPPRPPDSSEIRKTFQKDRQALLDACRLLLDEISDELDPN